MSVNSARLAGCLGVMFATLAVIILEAEPVLGQTLDPNPPAPWIKFVTGDLANVVLIVLAGVCLVGFLMSWITLMTALIILGGAMLVRICASYFLAGEIAWGTLFFTFIGAVPIVMLFDPVARIRRWEQRRLWGV